MIEQCFVGIDVSQDRLDVLLLPQATGFSVANNEAGWNALIARLRDLPVAAIGLEPSGGYERGVIRALLTASLSVRRINPNRLRQFARARGALAKNDRLDARLIAAYFATMPTQVVRHDPAAARIAEIVTVRRQLCDEHVAIENQAAQLEDAIYVDVEEAVVTSLFGAEFTRAIYASPLGSWNGPVRSAYGLHLVHVTQLRSGDARRFEDVRDAVMNDWRREQERNTKAAYLAKLRDKHGIAFDSGAKELLRTGPGAVRER